MYQYFPENKIIKDKNRFLIFFHTAKTGGTTLGTIIASCAKRKYIFFSRVKRHDPFGHWLIEDIEKKWLDLSDSERDKFTWTAGHVPFGIHKIFNKNCYYVGLIRRPGDLWLSSIFYNQLVRNIDQLKNRSLRDLIVEQKDTIYANPQTRQFSGAKPNEIIGSEHLKIAKKNIENMFLVVGLTERFDESIAYIATLLKWPIIKCLYKKKNETPKDPLRDSVGQDVLILINETNKLDCELYRFCENKFENKLSQLYGKMKMTYKFNNFILRYFN